MATYNDIVKGALLELGVLAGVEEPEAHDLERGLSILQEMLDQWSFEGLITTGLAQFEHTFTSDTALRSVTIGPAPPEPEPIDPLNPPDNPPEPEPEPIIAADFVPYKIVNVHMADSNYGGYSLTAITANIFLSREGLHDGIGSKPTHYWYEPDSPFGIMSFDSVPTIGSTLRITTEKYLVGAGIEGADEPDFLRGYQKAVRLNLAVEMASAYGVKGGKLSEITAGLAMQAKRDIRTVNLQRIGQTKFDKGALQNYRKFRRGGGIGYGRTIYDPY